jgi:hypothetical protein
VYEEYTGGENDLADNYLEWDAFASAASKGSIEEHVCEWDTDSYVYELEAFGIIKRENVE